MNRKRILAIGKLLVILGTPLALLVGLFSCGVWFGVEHRQGILELEQWMGLPVEVPTKTAEVATPVETKAAEVATPASEPVETKSDAGSTGTPPTVATPSTGTTPPPTKVEATPDAAAAVEPKIDPLAGDLAGKLGLPVKVKIRVLVDEDLVAARADWIDYVQRTVSRASHVYQQQFGIELELWSVGRWPIATDGLDSDQLLGDLRSRGREGADVLVGFTERPLDGDVSGKAETPLPDSAFNGAFAVVYAVPYSREPHLRTLLHEIGHFFGALDVTDPQDAAWQGGSWMSYAPFDDDQAPWIDAENRKRVIERKDKPFAHEARGEAATPATEGKER
jgi:hypothetical protein